MEDLSNKIWSEVVGTWRYRWWAATLAWLLFASAAVVVFLIHDVYQATARVYVDTQSILKPLLQNMATLPNLDQQALIMNRSLLSRTTIERVIKTVHMDRNFSSPKDMERTVQNMIKDIKLTGTGREDIYTITYRNENPRLAHDVVQALLTTFIDGTSGDKKQDTRKAVDFINEQIRVYEQKLSSAENALKEFKIRNAEVLPREGVSYATKLKEVTDQLEQAQLELRESEQTRTALRRQISAESPLSEQVAPPAADSEIERRLQTLRRNLDNLQMQYTERHPDIVSTKRLIAELEARRAQELAQPRAGLTKRANGPAMQQLYAALSEAEANHAALSVRVAEFQRRHARVKSMLSVVPEVESQLAGLNRDYQVNKENYEKLISRREAVRLSEDLNDAGIVRFRIIDPPIIPKKPASPNRFLLLSLALLLAIGGGFTGAFLINRLRPAFTSQSNLHDFTGLPVLGCVALTRSRAQQARDRRAVLAWSVLFGALVLAYAGTLFKSM